jgi:hypothetical protein
MWDVVAGVLQLASVVLLLLGIALSVWLMLTPQKPADPSSRKWSRLWSSRVRLR